MAIVSARPPTSLLSELRCFLLDHRENIPSGIFKPGDRRAIPTHDPLFVRLDVGQIINLKMHAALCQFVHRFIDIIDREIKDGEVGRSVIRLRINENVIAAGDV